MIQTLLFVFDHVTIQLSTNWKKYLSIYFLVELLILKNYNWWKKKKKNPKIMSTTNHGERS